MENIFSLQYGVAGVCVLLTIMVLLEVGKFLWSIQQKKESVSEATLTQLAANSRELTLALRLLESRLKSMEQLLGDLPKMKTDLQRFYTAMKEIAGEKWPAIREEMTKGGLTST